jgi:NAD(P)-dependent dehydrogenase (short-subunit alcohol dehydrogenase family)
MNVAASFLFSRGAILVSKDSKELDEPTGHRGTLIFTGATAATRGNIVTSAFVAGKSSVCALSQILAKEFGKENIYVAHVSLSSLSNCPFSDDEYLIVHY